MPRGDVEAREAADTRKIDRELPEAGGGERCERDAAQGGRPWIGAGGERTARERRRRRHERREQEQAAGLVGRDDREREAGEEERSREHELRDSMGRLAMGPGQSE